MNFKELLKNREGENYTLQSQYINPAFAKVLKIIGFDRVYTTGKGAYLYDKDGHEYLDFICGYGVFNLGRNHPKVKEVLIDYLNSDYPNLVKMDAPLVSGLLAEKLISKMPAGLERVFFANSGAEGVETALKFSKQYTGRESFVYTKGAFHGLTLGALSVNGGQHFRTGFGQLYPAEMVPFNDVEALEKALSSKKHAAFIVEPIQGKTLTVSHDTYLKEAQRLCKQYGTCFVVDEVQTGMGRTGKFLCLEYWNIEPDMVIISKSLSAGQVPISAVMGRKEIFDSVFSSLDRCVVHSSTFSQNAFACVAGLAALDVLEDEKLAQNAFVQGEYLMNALRARKEKYELLKDVRGKGLYIGVEFGEPKSFGLKMGWKLLHKMDGGLFTQAIIMPLMDKHKILTQVGGHNVDIIKLSPALTVTKADMDRFLTAFDDVMESCHQFPGPVWEVGKHLTQHALKQAS